MREKIYQWIFKKILEINKFNENGCGAGWYECFSIDRKAYDWIKRNKPTRTYWLTTNIYNIKFHNKIEDFSDIRFGVSDIKERLTSSGRLIVRFKVSIYEINSLVCSAKVQFIEAK